MLEKYLNKDFLLEHKQLIIRCGICLLVLIVCIAVYFSGHSADEEEVTLPENTQQQAEETLPEEVVVDISGAVISGRVVTLEAGSRVEDAIRAAGGLADDADLSGINRAAQLTDGQKIYIPTFEETQAGITYQADSQSENVRTDGLININTADEELLQTLSGIGPVTAEKIVSYRTTYGAFSSIDDLKEVNGIGDKTFDQIRDYITV